MHIGEFSALGVAICWTLSALFFEKAGSKIGSLSVNVIRLMTAIILLGLIAWVTRGYFLPTDATPYQWFWLSLSGFVGFFLGDLFLFHSYSIIGSRMAQLVMTLAPPITAITGLLMLNEYLSAKQALGICITVGGICIAMLGKKRGEKFNFNVPLKGFLFALGGAAGQAIGLVLSKKGMGDYNAISATQIRAITGGISFLLLVTFLNRWSSILKAFSNKSGVKFVLSGSVFGPVMGVSLSLFAVQHTKAGVAATLMGLVPILIIFPSALIFKEKITFYQVFGAFISVGGCVLLFL
ncbi:MAG: DMT family transporter [Lentimicrobiaceae bacterium]|nr:DMT family transporter [Lentimicrobiaceae bacterium]